jgi:hypothetical protein
MVWIFDFSGNSSRPTLSNRRVRLWCRAITSSSAPSRPATPTIRIGRGFALEPITAHAVVALTPPIDGSAGSILALLEGRESWSTSALACALGSSQRTVQRALRQLDEAAAVRAVGHAAPRAGSCRPLADSQQHCYSRARWRWVSFDSAIAANARARPRMVDS